MDMLDTLVKGVDKLMELLKRRRIAQALRHQSLLSRHRCYAKNAHNVRDVRSGFR
jgi:hypothetical protein